MTFPAIAGSARVPGWLPGTLLLLGASCLAAAPEVEIPPRENFHLFLLAGQSNMAGRGVVEEVDRAGDARILVFGNDGRWAIAREPLHWDKPGVAGVGPGLAFARKLLPDLPEGAVIGLIPAAFGGTKVEEWQKEAERGTRWKNGLSLYRNALEMTQAAARDGVLKAVLWNQGESNIGMARGDGGDEYRGLLYALIADLRKDLELPELPFVAATLGPWHERRAEALNRVVLSLPEEVSNTLAVDTNRPEFVSRLKNKVGDEAHYDAPSARLLGELYAGAYADLLKR